MLSYSLEDMIKFKDELKAKKEAINALFTGELTNNVNGLKDSYKSDSDKIVGLFGAFDKMANDFPDFIESLNKCISHLENDVIPAYQEAEN